MTTDSNQDGRVPDEVLAGEYVLGVLPMETRRMVERRMTEDRKFASAVERWQVELAPFDEDYQETAPNPAVFGQIERRLFGDAPAAVPATGIWNAAGFWRWVSLGTSLTAAVAVVHASGVFRQQTPTGAPLIAELSAPNSQVNLVASFDSSNGRLRIVPVAAGRPQEKSLQLWLVPGSGDPRPLGVFQPNAEGELLIPAELRNTIDDGSTLAVSLEPFGGSPTGLPTGPIVASGTARRI